MAAINRFSRVAALRFAGAVLLVGGACGILLPFFTLQQQKTAPVSASVDAAANAALAERQKQDELKKGAMRTALSLRKVELSRIDAELTAAAKLAAGTEYTLARGHAQADSQARQTEQEAKASQPSASAAAGETKQESLAQRQSASWSAEDLFAAEQKEKQQADCLDHLLTLSIAADPGHCIDVDTMVKNLEPGVYHHNSPASAYVGDDIPIVLTLETAKGQDVTGEFAGAPGQVTRQEAVFARTVEASLTGNNVSIDPKGPQQRTATSAAAVEWRWDVTPLRAGPARLDIEVVAELSFGEQHPRVQLKVLHDQIDIKATTLQTIEAAIGGANTLVTSLSALVGGLVALIGTLAPIRRALATLFGKLFHRSKPAAKA